MKTAVNTLNFPVSGQHTHPDVERYSNVHTSTRFEVVVNGEHRTLSLVNPMRMATNKVQVSNSNRHGKNDVDDAVE